MKFTIRDLFLVTVIVAVCTAWWLDRSRQAQVIERQNVELQTIRLKEEAARAVAEAEFAIAKAMAATVESTIKSLPTSQAPAPNPPKP